MMKLDKKLSQPEFADVRSQYNQQIEKRIKNGNFMFVEDIEDKNFSRYQKSFAPVPYSVKESSENTKVRPCVNSSFSTNGNPSFNDAQFSGSSGNFPIKKILTKLRSVKEVAQCDVTNFYQSIHTELKDSALNQIKMKVNKNREPVMGEAEGEFKDLICTRVNYGNKSSQFLSSKLHPKVS